MEYEQKYNYVRRVGNILTFKTIIKVPISSAHNWNTKDYQGFTKPLSLWFSKNESMSFVYVIGDTISTLFRTEQNRLHTQYNELDVTWHVQCLSHTSALSCTYCANFKTVFSPQMIILYVMSQQKIYAKR